MMPFLYKPMLNKFYMQLAGRAEILVGVGFVKDRSLFETGRRIGVLTYFDWSQGGSLRFQNIQ